MLVTAITGAEVAYLFIAAGLLMLLWEAPPRRLLPRRGRTSQSPRRPARLISSASALSQASSCTGAAIRSDSRFVGSGRLTPPHASALSPARHRGPGIQAWREQPRLESLWHWADRRVLIVGEQCGDRMAGELVAGAGPTAAGH